MGFPQHTFGADERRVLAVRPHRRVLVRPALVLLVLAPVTGGVAGLVGSNGVGSVLRALVLVLGCVVVFRGAVVPFLVWRSTVYIVTTRRVAVRGGVLRRFGRDVPLDRVSKVTSRTGLWDRLFGSGRIRIDAHGEAPLVLDHVPAVETVRHAVQTYAGRAADRAAEEPDEPFEDGPDGADFDGAELDGAELDGAEPSGADAGPEADVATWRRRRRGGWWPR